MRAFSGNYELCALESRKGGVKENTQAGVKIRDDEGYSVCLTQISELLTRQAYTSRVKSVVFA